MNEADQLYASAIKSLDDKGLIVGFGPGEFLAGTKPAMEPTKMLRQILSFLKAVESGRITTPKWAAIIGDIERCIKENEKP